MRWGLLASGGPHLPPSWSQYSWSDDSYSRNPQFVLLDQNIELQNFQVSDPLLDCLGRLAYPKPGCCHHTLCSWTYNCLGEIIMISCQPNCCAFLEMPLLSGSWFETARVSRLVPGSTIDSYLGGWFSQPIYATWIFTENIHEYNHQFKLFFRVQLYPSCAAWASPWALASHPCRARFSPKKWHCKL